ncbi:SOS response-associated peptidase family protein [Lactobacillus sp. ESL0701]|uniref:SOS response-associated peptidase family protein n=1 Tax=Lactobacillus sp. ESL0701 TaxID=2983217 RepID=UPI0023F862AC|nr:SOS response-associated peptidase family protein [Lactobacillus sp. ESL0701]MDF7672545.1 SOS response-associated peptidase family protein [Lactobacillus sp. ESL0701]
MCNQFQLPSLAEIKKYLVADLNLPLVEPTANLPQSQPIFPKAAAPILLYQNNQLQLVPKTWGYPSPVDNKKVIFNARVERFFETKSSMWDKSFAKSRCIIIAKQFWESGRQTYTVNQHTYHERYSFRDPNAPLTLIAGIYQGGHFSMVTTKPNANMAPIHDRMPLVITPAELRRWLFQNFTNLVDRSSLPLAVNKLPQRK